MSINESTFRAARLEELRAAQRRLEAGLSALVASGSWSAYLQFSSRFHQYSFGNSLLILLQKPEATRVASYRTWARLGRHVRRGERGIRILVPLVVHKASAPESQAPVSAAPVAEILVGFKTGCVFDVSQTEGTPLPEAPLALLQGDDGGLIAALDGFAREVLQIEIEETATLEHPGANGECQYGPDGKAMRIRILKDNPARQHAKTRAHEIAHALLHSHTEYQAQAERSLQELEAESVAFMVLDHFGIDSGAYSFGYLAGWGGGAQAVQLLLFSGERIRRSADRILTWIETRRPPQSKDAIQPAGEIP